jgi:hypothetical protein
MYRQLNKMKQLKNANQPRSSLTLACLRVPHLTTILHVVHYHRPFLSENLDPATSLPNASLMLSQNIAQVAQPSQRMPTMMHLHLSASHRDQ